MNLESLELGDTRLRKNVTGGLLIQILGKDGKDKARRLQSKLQDVLSEEASITIPSKRVEVRIIGFDDSVMEDEILEKVTSVGGCTRCDVRLGQIKSLFSGLCAVWLQCPVDAVQRLVKAGRIRLGWTSARVVLLPPRKLQCFRCLEFGHMKATCPSSEDRSALCYRCGEEGHKANSCSNRIRCPVCASRGQSSTHRVGSEGCSAKRVVGVPQGRRGLRGPSMGNSPSETC